MKIEVDGLSYPGLVKYVSSLSSTPFAWTKFLNVVDLNSLREFKSVSTEWLQGALTSSKATSSHSAAHLSQNFALGHASFVMSFLRCSKSLI